MGPPLHIVWRAGGRVWGGATFRLKEQATACTIFMDFLCCSLALICSFRWVKPGDTPTKILGGGCGKERLAVTQSRDSTGTQGPSQFCVYLKSSPCFWYFSMHVEPSLRYWMWNASGGPLVFLQCPMRQVDVFKGHGLQTLLIPFVILDMEDFLKGW